MDIALADSPFNARELVEFGFREARVFPLYVDFAKYEKPANAFVHRLFRDDRTNILFVGRVAPNKKIEDLIKVTFYYKKYISPLVRLDRRRQDVVAPGLLQEPGPDGDEFHLQAEEVRFLGHLPDDELFAVYRAADVFLSLSEHEGFCLPLVESMVFDLPVVAYDSTAVPDTLGGAGILVREKRVDRVAELVDIVAHDQRLREPSSSRGQRERLADFKTQGREPFLRRHRIRDILGG